MTDLKFNSNGQEQLSINDESNLWPIGTEAPLSKLIINKDFAEELSLHRPEPGYIYFQPRNSTEALRLDKDGMTFMGHRIEDAGEAYDAWMKTMAMMQEGFRGVKPLSEADIDEAYGNNCEIDNWSDFREGVRFAEKTHGITGETE